MSLCCDCLYVECAHYDSSNHDKVLDAVTRLYLKSTCPYCLAKIGKRCTNETDCCILTMRNGTPTNSVEELYNFIKDCRHFAYEMCAIDFVIEGNPFENAERHTKRYFDYIDVRQDLSSQHLLSTKILVRDHHHLDFPSFITTLLASGQNPPSITQPNQFILDRESLSLQDFARHYEPLEELHVNIHCHSFNKVFFQDSYHNKINKKYPSNQKFVDAATGSERVHLSRHQATLLYDNKFHRKNPFYDRQSFCNYPPSDDSSLLFAHPRVIHPTFPPNLSPLHVQIFPNGSTRTYDKHVHDYPIGCETDVTLIFYHEHDAL